MTGTRRPNRTVRPTSKQPPMRYIRHITDVPEASAELVDLGAYAGRPKRPHMADMPVIVSTKIEARCASITGMIRHYAEPEGRGDLLITHIMPLSGRCLIHRGWDRSRTSTPSSLYR